MTPYYDSLPASVKKNLEPLLPVMRKAAEANGISVDLLLSIAAKESGGRNVIGDKKLKQQAKGIYQIRDAKFWTGGVDPTDSVAATPALAKRLAKVSEGCGGDPVCVHFKYMSGQNRSYDPKTVERIKARNSHVAPRLDDVARIFAMGEPTAPSAPATPATTVQAPPSPAAQTLAFAPPEPEYADPYAALMGGAQDVPNLGFTSQMGALLGPGGARPSRGVKSAPPPTMFGLTPNE